MRMQHWRRAAAAAGCGVLILAGCTPPQRAEVEPAPFPGPQQELSFDTPVGTTHGTLALPEADPAAPVPAALIIAGSGPTDRDGNSELRPDADTNRNLARELAAAGVASLRYDKLGSGETGMGALDSDTPAELAMFEDQVAAAYSALAERPEVDADRLLVVGHSEGGLFALLSPELTRPRPAGLVLVAPLGTRYLDLVDRQVTESVRGAEAAGRLEAAQAESVLAELRLAVARLRAGETLPSDLDPQLGGLFNRTTAPYLRQADALDPRDLARELPADTPALVLWGTADGQVAEDEVQGITAALPEARRVDLADADHVLRIHEQSPGAPVLDAQREFSDEVAPALRAFLEDLGW